MKLTKEHWLVINSIEEQPRKSADWIIENKWFSSVADILVIWGIIKVSWFATSSPACELKFTEAGRYIIEIESKKLIDPSV